MTHATTALVLLGCAALSGAQQPAPAKTHDVTIPLAEANGTCNVGAVADVNVSVGDTISWRATATGGKCGDRKVKLARFVLKGTATGKDPLRQGCKKEMTSGGASLACQVDESARGQDFKYDVEVEGGKGVDPEIRVHR